MNRLHCFRSVVISRQERMVQQNYFMGRDKEKRDQVPIMPFEGIPLMV